jgi:hypothetical protein
MAKRLGDTLQTIEHVDRSEHVRRVGALTPARLDEAVLLETVEQGFKRLQLGPTDEQAGAELDQHRGVEAVVLQG